MTDGASLLMELYRRGEWAMRDASCAQDRERLFNLIAEFEWAFPEIKQEVDAIYHQGEVDVT